MSAPKKPVDSLDALFEEAATVAGAKSDATEASAAYRKKRAEEEAKIAAGIGVYTAEEIAAHEAEEAAEEDVEGDEQ